jgi:sugar phosphate isomerase/epimerase
MAMEPGRREALAGLLEDLELHVVLGVGFDYLSDDPDEVARGTDAVLEALEVLPGPMRTPVCSTGLSRRVHRYSRDVPLEEQLDRFSEVLAPLAAAAQRAGCPLAIHKVGHYGRDLAELCRRTPHLGIELDTGNAFLIGEPPLEAARAAAPYTVATHFKDHYVEPSFDPLGMKVRGAVPGEGDADLGAIYDVLMMSAPRPEELVMLMEIDPVEGLDQRTALARAVEFLRGLEPRLTWTI